MRISFREWYEKRWATLIKSMSYIKQNKFMSSSKKYLLHKLNHQIVHDTFFRFRTREARRGCVIVMMKL